jgi:hypothetical protein
MAAEAGPVAVMARAAAAATHFIDLVDPNNLRSTGNLKEGLSEV